MTSLNATVTQSPSKKAKASSSPATRRVLVAKTFKDEEGFDVTEETWEEGKEDVWCIYFEDIWRKMFGVYITV